MRGSRSPVADEYNEDTDKANDSEDDQWEESKLVIDLDPNTSMSTSENSKPSTAGSQSKDTTSKPTEDNFTPPEPKMEKAKGRRGFQRKNDKSETKDVAKANSKQGKVDKDKPTPNKPGRKRKEKPAAKSASSGDRHSPSSAGSPTDPYKFETEEGICATALGKHANKANRSDSAVAMKDAQTDYDWRSVASITEPEHLAPCEPGTQVCLEGIVWQETNNGVLIVNVTWRGKTYMGTLLDATKHDWSPPSCDSPVAELEGRTPKGRGKRSRVPLSDTFKDINERKLRKEMRKQSGANHPPASPAKSDNGKRRNRNSEGDTGEPISKRGRAAARNTGGSTHSTSPPALIECPEPNCGKKYKQMNGLKYHQKNAHQDTMSHVSDSLSETEKQELLSSPDENKRTKRKNKGDNTKSILDSKPVKTEPEEPESKPSDNSAVTQTNTTSVITSTTTQISNSSPQTNVPVAAITPQIVKPAANGVAPEEQTKPSANQQQAQSTTSVPVPANRSLPSAPKLFPKSSCNSMAPISTITSQGGYNSSLKPIQPKPTILGESTPNPTLTDLKDHKKLKRKRSASRDDLTNGTGSPYAADSKLTQKLEAERKSPHQPIPTVLQSPSYSDISEEGEIRNARREMLSKPIVNDSMCPPPAVYPVATVSPQKNIPQPSAVMERDRSKPPSHTSHTSLSPVPKAAVEERARREAAFEIKQRELEILNRQYQQMAGWQPAIAAGMHPEHFYHMAVRERERERQQRQSVSPRPSSIKTSPAPQSKDFEAKASSDRLQLLKENKDMKPQTSGIHQPEMMPDLQTLQREEMNKFLMFQTMQQNQQKRESLQTHSPAHKPTSTPSKVPEFRPDGSRVSRSSPMPPQPGPGGFMPFMSSQLFPFHSIPGLSPSMAPGFLPPGFPYPGLPDMKDHNRPGSSPMFSKPDHKIHELESMRSAKSPRPPTDKANPAKSHQVMPPHTVFSAAAAAGLNGPGLPGYFQQK